MWKRRGRESNPRIAVLQTAALPLGYRAGFRKLARRRSRKQGNVTYAAKLSYPKRLGIIFRLAHKLVASYYVAT